MSTVDDQEALDDLSVAELARGRCEYFRIVRERGQ